MNIQERGAEILRLLDKLGSTPDEIATTLKDLGIRGTVGASGRCPIANYLTQENPGCTYAVSHDLIYEYPDDLGQHLLFSTTTPMGVSDFIVGFDLRGYPDLEQ